MMKLRVRAIVWRAAVLTAMLCYGVWGMAQGTSDALEPGAPAKPSALEKLGASATLSAPVSGSTTGVDGASGPPSEALGDLLHMRGRYLAAIRTFEAVEPKTAALWNKIGVSCEHMLMFDKAKLSFERALQTDSHYAEAYNNLGTLYHSQGDLNRAEKLYRKALKLKPHSADTYQNLGTLLYSKRKFKKGDEAYRQALAIDPGVLERSAQHGIQAQSKGKTNSEIHYHLACTLAEAGNTSLALEYLRRSILEGFHDRDRMLRERQFAELRTTPVFLSMVEDLQRQ